jgi:hypothetical protein
MTAQATAWTGALGGAIAFADAMTYLILIYKQGEASAVVPWVFSMIVAGAIAALYGSFSTSGSAWLLLIAAGSLFSVLGVIGIFSIGLPLLLAAGLCYLGAAQISRLREGRSRSRLGVMIGALAIVAVVGTTLLLAQLVTGGERISVVCRGSAQGPAMPSLAGSHPQTSAFVPHPCRTVLSH